MSRRTKSEMETQSQWGKDAADVVGAGHGVDEFIPATTDPADPFAKAISFADLDQMTFREPSYLVPRVIVLGGVVLLAGPPKIGKSHLALGIGLAVAQGGKALYALQVIHAGPVLFISLDDTSAARAQHRARKINHGEPLPRDMTLHTEANLGRGEQARDNLARYLRGRGKGTALVVVDTLSHLRGDRGHTESVYDADIRFMGIIRTLVPDNPDTTFWGLTHIRKLAADDGVQAVTGTYGITGGADSVITMTGNRFAPGRVIEVIGRDDPGGEYVLRFTDHGLMLTDEDPHDPALFMSADDARVYRTLAGCTSPVTAMDLAPMLPGVTKIGDRLTRLVKHGAAKRVRRGEYEAV